MNAKSSERTNDDDLDEPGETETDKTKAAAKRKKKSKKKSKQLTPRPDIPEVDDPWRRRTGRIDAFNGDTQRASKEVLRAYLSGDNAVFKKLLEEDETVVANVHVRQSCDVDMDVERYALLAEDGDALEALRKEDLRAGDEAKNGGRRTRPPMPECTLLGLSSGRHSSRYADYNRYNVGATRGGKEGNNAFVEDLVGGGYEKRTSRDVLNARSIVRLLETHDSLSISFLEFLNAKFFGNFNLFDWNFDFHKCLIYGHREIAQYLMKIMLPRGVGLNSLHVDTLGEGHEIEKILPVSVVKKSSTNVRFCPVHCAASNPNPTYLKQLLHKKPDAINCLDSDEAGLVHYAAVGERPDTLAWLLKGPGATLDRHARTRKGGKTTPLMWAARAGRAENVGVLCEGLSGDDDDKSHFEIKDAAGMTAMHHVAASSRRGRFETARVLMKCGANPDVPGDVRLLGKRTPSMTCAARGDLELLKVLVEGGADPARADKLGKTALTYAAKNGHTHVLSYLLRLGVDPDAADTSSNAPMHYASAYGWVDCVALLLRAGAHADPRNDWSSTPLELALKKGRYGCAVVLLKERVDVNVRDKNGVSLFNSLVLSYVDALANDPKRPLPWAVRKIVDREELDVTCADSSGKTLLHHIAQGAADVAWKESSSALGGLVDQILSRGVDPLLECKDGRVAVEMALERGSLELALKLLRNASHANVAAKDKNLMHRLMTNIRKAHGILFMEIFAELHECNAEWIEQVDNDGYTPLMYAARDVQSNWINHEQKKHSGKVMRKPTVQNKGIFSDSEFEDYSDEDSFVEDQSWQQRDELGKQEDACVPTMKETLEKLFDKLAERLGDVLSRKKSYRVKTLEHLKKELESFPKKSDHRIKGGIPQWNFTQEYADGPRTVLHYILQCPDVKWAFYMSKRILKHADESLLHLKTNEGKDALAFSLETFVYAKAPVQPTLDLLKMLKEKGAQMNGVTHPLFSSLSEAEHDIAEVQFDATDYSMEDAYDFIRFRQQVFDKEKLADDRQRHCLHSQFEPHLHMLLKRNKDRIPSPKLLQGLIEICGFSPDCKDVFGNTALHMAPRLDIELVRRLLPFGDINIVNNEGATPLVLSVKKAEVVNLLIENGANVDVVSKKGAALHLAARNQSCDIVKALLKKCNVDVADCKGRTALHYAVATGAVSEKEMLDPIENQLLLAGANVNAADKYGRVPLHYAFFSTDTDVKCTFPPAAARDPIDMVTTLARSEGINLAKADEDMRTPLHYASAVGASICVLYLCENSTDSLHSVDVDNNTALGFALMAGKGDTATLLISRGSMLTMPVSNIVRTRENGRVKEVSKQVQSTLWFALKDDCCQSVARYMLAAKKLTMNSILSSLLSTENFQLTMQQIKLCSSRELQVPDERSGMTGLHHLANVMSFREAPAFAPALADEMVGRGVEISARCKRGRTCLHYACFRGHTNLCRHLISAHDADVDIQDLQNNTPLSLMFEGSHASEELLCLLANASKSQEHFANHPLAGKYDKNEETQWRERSDLEEYFLSTPKEEQHAEEAYIERLKSSLDRKRSAPSKSIVLSIESTPLIQSLNWNYKLTNALFSFGANGDKADENGRTVLHHAVITNDFARTDLILKWNCVQLDALDKFGRSALTYAVLASLDGSSDETLDHLLLDYGADPRFGNAMELAIRANRQELIRRMLKTTNRLIEKPKRQKSSYGIGDLIWVRYSDYCTAWELATVTSIQGPKVGVLPVELAKKMPLSLDDQHCLVVSGKGMEIHKMKMESDVILESNQNIMLSLMSDSSIPIDRKLALIKEHEGCEVQLLKKLPASPTKESLSAEFSLGDAVGYLTNLSSPKLYVGKVIAAHKNGQYDVDLLNGKTILQVNRFILRPLRSELAISTKSKTPKLSANLIHACVRPMRYGSFEDLGVLRALVEVGVPANEKDKNGETPLDKARPGSEIQQYLREITSSQEGRPLPERHLGPTADGIDNQADADQEYAALLAAGADISERITPKVSNVCELDSIGTSVLADGEDFFDVVLSKVDVEHGRYGKYVFYKMQIVFDPIRKTYVLITNWGRIGETGKYQQTPFSVVGDCVKEFKKVFKSKAGNEWDARDSFERKSGKYVIVQRPKTRLKHPEKLLQSVVESSQHPSSLPTSVSNIFRFLLDAKSLSRAYLHQRCIDSSMLPFGQLSLSTIQAAEAKLLEVKLKLEEKEKACNENKSVLEIRKAYEALSMASNEFYELMPKGDDIVTPFSSDDEFKNAYDLIRELRDLTVSKQLLLGARHHQASMNPMDYVYKSLGVNIRPLEEECPVRRCLLRHIDNTCGGPDTLIHQIYALDDGKEACDVPNKRLLFHGSRNQNILGILKNGLLVAPPEAPVTGWAFGKGVYFADQFKKALNYTDVSNYCSLEGDDRPRGFVFVAEVALGESYKPSGVEYMEKSPGDTKSTYALGEQTPDASKEIVLDSTGARVSLGELRTSEKIGSGKYRWKHSDPSQPRWRSSSYLDDNESMRVDKLCLDPDTRFPLQVPVQYKGTQHYLTLLGPNSTSANMKKSLEEKRVVAKKSGKKEQSNMAVIFDDSDSDQEMELRIESESESEEDIRIFDQRAKEDRANEMIFVRELNTNRGGFSQSEFIVYDTRQVRLKYLIELTSQEWVKRKFLKDTRSKKVGGDCNDGLESGVN